MEVSDAISMMLTFGIFLIALLTYIDTISENKNAYPVAAG